MNQQQPQNKRPSLGSSSFLPIKVLTTYTTRWRIQARVMNKTPLTTFTRKGVQGSQGSIFTATLMDSEGTQIACKFWNEAADKFHPILEKGKIYKFGKGRINVANKRFSNNVEHDYEIHFESPTDAEVVPLDDNDETTSVIPVSKTVTYSSLRSIELSTKKLPFTVSLLVLVQKCQPMREILSKNGEKLQVMNVTVVDATEYSLEIALWGEQSTLEINTDEVPILSITNVQIKENRGGRSGSCLRSSEVTLNPDSSDATALKQWFIENSNTATFKSLSASLDRTSIGATGNEITEATVAEIQEVVQKGSYSEAIQFKVDAYISRIIYRNVRQENVLNLVYSACAKCNRKLTNEGESAYCQHCDQQVTATYRMLFGAILTDQSGGGFSTRVFNETVSGGKINQMEEKEVTELCEYSALWKPFSFNIRLRKDTYNGEVRSNITVGSITPASSALVASMAIQRILKVLPNAFDIEALTQKRPLTDVIHLEPSKKVRLDVQFSENKALETPSLVLSDQCDDRSVDQASL